MRLLEPFIETKEMKQIREKACTTCTDNCSNCSIYLNKDKRI